ncbi:translation initiation factor IF-2-like [Pollicipes pollicipes]|uniref:translation initiation factor IF-2-like n=1 Tax=Pollicipes pollicipes TaxID=41117 RepID=UPI001885911B|nr:translation initiation factor IF-2-like [Pollicipes pollicipes]
MPNRKKFNARFPPARIKKIMRTDKEVGKVAAPVPAVISRALELFAEQLLHRAGDVTMSRGSRTLSPAHLKQCILSEQRFDFLKDLVANVPDAVESEEGPSATAVSSQPAPAAAARPVPATPARPVPATPARPVPVPAAGPADTRRSVGRPPKYLKVDMPSSASASTNGQPHSAPPGRPPVPDLIHTSMLGLTGGAVTAGMLGDRFSFAAGAPFGLAAGLYGAPASAPRLPAGRID